tara:strand:- start:3792 stop:4619 length:828 start_codon:yes stop_codon:yes gene_type:complete
MVNFITYFTGILTILAAVSFTFDYIILRPVRIERNAYLQQVFTTRERSNIENRNEFIDLAASLLPWLLALLLFRTLLFDSYYVPSKSMHPTLNVGDRLAVSMFDYSLKDPFFGNQLVETGTPERGDIVVFKNPEQPTTSYVKRVIGLPGDTIKIDNGRVTVSSNCSSKCEVIGMTGEMDSETLNDNTYQVAFLPPEAPEPEDHFNQYLMPEGEYLVPEHQYFVMGDNRKNSHDSRYFGFVSHQDLIGKARAVIIGFDNGELTSPNLRRAQILSSK